MSYEFKVAWCPYCNQGWVEIVKSAVSGHLLLLCEECETLWRKPEDILLGKASKDSLTGAVEVPTVKEIEAIGWDINIIKEL